MEKPTLIIAEAGVNHNGDLNIAFKLIEAAAKAGVDFVKFQTFKTEALVSVQAKQADYQAKNLGGAAQTQFEMLKKLELTPADHHALIAHCRQCGIRFLSTAFDLESIDFLATLDLAYFKIPSGEITNLPYLQKIGKLKKSVILSTGMSVLSEIQDAIQILIDAGTLRENISVLHCTTEYPAPLEEVNLNVIRTLHERLQLPVGYSDHTEGIEVSVAAVALGACIIEKHFTLDKNIEGPDHKASLNPDELTALVRSIRNVEKALGDGVKKVTASETKNKTAARKSIFTARKIAAGTVLKSEDLIMLRPGDGISPMEIHQIIGKSVKHDLDSHHKIVREDVQ
ncbi:MAG: N-acetylneuraminate synthase [Bacteroidetes bacterium HGW-Bacteroidetes-21]|nr:MAG: N-acetylneuraminate synthase [Bacteroidetes bacterium HGW-Bacteroidetes-21]